ncbi:MAG: Mrp/NBP35 family ATP-binding protein [Bernardetiaceae bacterium]
MRLNEKSVLEALARVQDPDLKKDLVSLGMIKDIVIKDKALSFRVVLTTPACPLKEKIRKDCLDAIESHLGADLEVSITMDAQVTSVRTGPILPQVKNIIAVASGKGGVGKSTVTANLALALSDQGAKVGILDADIFGPSIPILFDCQTARPGVIEREGKSILIPVERYGIKLLSIGFIAPPDAAVVWRGPMASSALRQFIGDADWGELDYLLIDLPPGTSDVHLTLVQTVPVTGAVVVTTPQKVALADAQKGIGMFQQPKIKVPILGVVENMAYFTPEELPDSKYYLFGKDGGKVFAKRNEVPFLGEIPLVQALRESGDAGKPLIFDNRKSPVVAAFAEVAARVAQHIAVRNAELPATEVVEIVR